MLNNTLVDRTPFSKGNYVITLLKSSSAFTCQDASREFALFLDRYYGKPLPSPWSLNSSKKIFAMKNGLGFQTTPAITGLGGARNPTAGGGVTEGTLCRSTYTVTGRNTRLDKFVLTKGKYSVWTIGQLSCNQASRTSSGRSRWDLAAEGVEAQHPRLGDHGRPQEGLPDQAQVLTVS